MKSSFWFTPESKSEQVAEAMLRRYTNANHRRWWSIHRSRRFGGRRQIVAYANKQIHKAHYVL